MSREEEVIKKATQVLARIKKENQAREQQTEAEKRQFVKSVSLEIAKLLSPAIDDKRAVMKEATQEMASILAPAIEQAANKNLNLVEIVRQAVKEIKIQMPELEIPPIEVPKAEVNVKVDPIEVPEPRVTVNVPKAEPRVTVKPPAMTALTKEIRQVKKAISEQRPIEFPEQVRYTRKSPMPVLMTDLKGDPWFPTTSSGGGKNILYGPDGNKISSTNPLPVTNNGTFLVQENGDALTALQLIDDVVQSEDSAHTSGDAGVMPLAVRQDSQSNLGADGDYVPLTLNSNGELRVTTSAGTEYTQDQAHADPATAPTFLMARDDVLSTQETTDGDWTLPRANARGAQWVEIDGTNDVNVSLDGESVAVTNAGTFPVQIDGDALTSLQTIDNIVQTEDAAHGSGDNGVMPLAVRNDAQTAIAANGDYIPLTTDSSGSLYTNDTVAQALLTTLSNKIEATTETHFDSDGDNTAQAADTSASKLHGMEVSNPNSADAYIQFFDAATGSVTVGTTTPKLSFLVPAGDGTKDGAMDKNFSVPIAFNTAMTYACTTTATGNGDPTTGLIVNIYKN